MEQYGGKFFESVKGVVSAPVIIGVIMVFVIVFPDDIIRIIVGAMVIFYSYTVFDIMTANMILGIYLVGLLYLNSYESSVSTNKANKELQKQLNELPL